jgi:hypothetical protein
MSDGLTVSAAKHSAGEFHVKCGNYMVVASTMSRRRYETYIPHDDGLGVEAYWRHREERNDC